MNTEWSRDGVGHADNDTRYVPNGKPFTFSGVAHESRYKWLLDNYDLAGKLILDFGCGSGYGAFMLAQHGAIVHALDISKTAIEYAQETYVDTNLQFFQLDACCRDEVLRVLRPESYDLIVSFDVIEHLERYFDYLENICNLVKTDGTVIIGCPNRLETFNWNPSWNRFHFQEFSPYQLRRILMLYFQNVALIAQDFKDESKRERIRRLNNQGDAMRHLMKGIIRILQRYHVHRAPIKTYRLECTDLHFMVEPPEEILRRAVGLIAVCQNPTSTITRHDGTIRRI
jgi:2-polyprenyl-3-methyl-5-hydroxy-6-metoxy-1,4-benzoquinol methylase